MTGEKTQNDPRPGALRFAGALARRELLLTEGALLERLRRDSRIAIDPHVANASLLYSEPGRAALLKLWRGYLDVARAYGLGMLICTPTWRANPERLRLAGLPSCAAVSEAAVALLTAVRAEYAPDISSVFIGGLMACRGDAYSPSDGLTTADAERFHDEQVRALVDAGVDVLLAATLPALPEALGLARVLAHTGLPYVLSFVVRPTGTLLDGTALADAIASVDNAVTPPPAAYFGNCVHPALFERALAVANAARPGVTTRVAGLQGNASRKSPEELDCAATLDCDDPDVFAEAMASLRARFGIHVVGGCCGTDERHIEALARHCR